MRDKIARIIDPQAFAMEEGAPLRAELVDVAYSKADQILALQFELDELPADVLETIADLEARGVLNL